MADDLSISNIYDEALKKLQAQRVQTGQASKAAFEKLTTDTQAGYGALDREAVINKALSERANGTAGDRIATIAQRRQTAFKNTLGENKRQRRDFEDSVDLTLKNYETRRAADDAAIAAQYSAVEDAALVSQGNFDKQLNLQERQLNLQKKQSEFSRAQKLFADNLIDAKGFEGMTGITVRKPKPKRVAQQQYIVYTGSDSSAPDDGHEYYSNGVMVDGKLVWYHIRYDFFYDAMDHEVELRNADGSYKSDTEVLMEMYGYIPEEENYSEAYENIEANQDEITSQYGEAMYGLLLSYTGIKSGYQLLYGTEYYQGIADVDDMINHSAGYIAELGYDGYLNELYSKIGEAFDYYEEHYLLPYENMDSALAKSQAIIDEVVNEEVVSANVGSGVFAAPPSELRIIETHRDELVEEFGTGVYNALYSYYYAKQMVEILGGIEDADVQASMDFISFIENSGEYISTNGASEFYTTLNQLMSESRTALEPATEAIGNASGGISVQTAHALGIDELEYSDTFEDKVRERIGVVPAGFDIEPYIEDIPLTESIEMPEVWTQETLSQVLSEILQIIETGDEDAYQAAYNAECDQIMLRNPEITPEEAINLAIQKVEEDVLIFVAGFMFEDPTERDEYIAQMQGYAEQGFAIAEESGLQIGFNQAINAYLLQLQLDKFETTDDFNAGNHASASFTLAAARDDHESDGILPESGHVIGTYDIVTFFLNDNVKMTDGSSIIPSEVNDLIAIQLFYRATGQETDPEAMAELESYGLYEIINIINATQEGDYVTLTENAKRQLMEKALADSSLLYSKALEEISTSYSEHTALDSLDYEEYSKIGAQMTNPSIWEASSGSQVNNKVAYAAYLFSDQCIADLYSAGHLTNISITLQILAQQQKEYQKYTYMTDEEVGVYNYLLAKEGEESANYYLELLDDTLKQRQGEANAEALEGRRFAQVAYSIPAGLDQFGRGIAQLFSSDRLSKTVTEYTAAAIYEDLANDADPDNKSRGQVLFDIGTSIGNMAPAILLSAATGGLGAPTAVSSAVGSLTIGLSAKGNAYAYALDMGYSKQQAETYSILIGASEAGLQYLLGGISSLGGKLSEGVIKQAIQNIDSAFLRIAAEIPMKMISEGVEEYMQSILEPAFRNLAFHEHNTIDFFSKDAMYSFFLGAITAGILESPFAIARGISNVKAGKGVLQSNHYEDLIDRAMAMDSRSEAYRLASEMNAGRVNTNEYNVGELIKTFAREGGDTSFMSVPNTDAVDAGTTNPDTNGPRADYNTVQNATTELTDGNIKIQTEQAVDGSIREGANNPGTAPQVQTALIDGMTALTKIESRIQSDSGIVNHQGIDIESSHNAYMDFGKTPGTIADSPAKRAMLGNAAQAMAGDIGQAIATGQLSAAEVAQLQGILAGLTGSAELAATYVEQVTVGADMGMVSANVDESGESGYNGKKNPSNFDNAPRTDEIVVEFNYNEQHDEAEFARQLEAQEAGMNQLTIEEYLRNRERYNAEGRSTEGNALQQRVRKKAVAQKILELREAGLSYSEAKAQAKLWAETQAALHNPDQIAGGNPLDIGGMGDARINSSIGSQWKYRIGTVDEYINSFLQGLSREEISNTYLNIRLTYKEVVYELYDLERFQMYTEGD